MALDSVSQTSHGCTLSLKIVKRDFSGKLVARVDASPFCTSVTARQTGQEREVEAGLDMSRLVRQSSQLVCEQESSFGSVMRCRQIEHCRFPVIMLLTEAIMTLFRKR